LRRVLLPTYEREEIRAQEAGIGDLYYESDKNLIRGYCGLLRSSHFMQVPFKVRQRMRRSGLIFFPRYGKSCKISITQRGAEILAEIEREEEK
jgi:hypothetical protein